MTYNVKVKVEALSRCQMQQTETEKWPVRLVTASSQDNTEIHDMVLADQRITEWYVAMKLDISQECFHVLIHNDL